MDREFEVPKQCEAKIGAENFNDSLSISKSITLELCAAELDGLSEDPEFQKEVLHNYHRSRWGAPQYIGINELQKSHTGVDPASLVRLEKDQDLPTDSITPHTPFTVLAGRFIVFTTLESHGLRQYMVSPTGTYSVGEFPDFMTQAIDASTAITFDPEPAAPNQNLEIPIVQNVARVGCNGLLHLGNISLKNISNGETSEIEMIGSDYQQACSTDYVGERPNTTTLYDSGHKQYSISYTPNSTRTDRHLQSILIYGDNDKPTLKYTTFSDQADAYNPIFERVYLSSDGRTEISSWENEVSQQPDITPDEYLARFKQVFDTPDRYIEFEESQWDIPNDLYVALRQYGKELFDLDETILSMEQTYGVTINTDDRSFLDRRRRAEPLSLAELEYALHTLDYELRKYPPGMVARVLDDVHLFNRFIYRFKGEETSARAFYHNRSIAVPVITSSIIHEIAHAIDDANGIMPLDNHWWGERAHGTNFHAEYEYDASGPGFARTYGRRNPDEDLATIAEKLLSLRDYSGFTQRANDEPSLAQKIRMTQAMYYVVSDGRIDEGFWKNRMQAEIWPDKEYWASRETAQDYQMPADIKTEVDFYQAFYDFGQALTGQDLDLAKDILENQLRPQVPDESYFELSAEYFWVQGLMFKQSAENTLTPAAKEAFEKSLEFNLRNDHTNDPTQSYLSHFTKVSLLYRQLEDGEKEIEALREVIKNPNLGSEWPYGRLSQLLPSQSEVLEILLTGFEVFNGDVAPAFALRLAFLLETSGNRGQALEVLEKALKENRGNQELITTIGRLERKGL